MLKPSPIAVGKNTQMRNNLENKKANKYGFSAIVQFWTNAAKTIKTFVPWLLVSAILFPVAFVVAFAAVDYGTLRNAIMNSEPAFIEKWVQSLICVGIIFGAYALMFSEYYFNLVHPYDQGREESYSDSWRIVNNEGRQLALREITLSRCLPNVDAHWLMVDLAKRLQGTKEGSDILDRQVFAALKIAGPALKPTQIEQDAIALLQLRYGGMKSSYEWAVEHRPHVGVAIKVRESENKPWLCTAVEDGHTTALAIVRCVLLREMELYTYAA